MCVCVCVCQNVSQVVYLKTFLALGINNAFTVQKKIEERSANLHFFS
jgi:hypothetical protein